MLAASCFLLQRLMPVFARLGRQFTLSPLAEDYCSSSSSSSPSPEELSPAVTIFSLSLSVEANFKQTVQTVCRLGLTTSSPHKPSSILIDRTVSSLSLFSPSSAFCSSQSIKRCFCQTDRTESLSGQINFSFSPPSPPLLILSVVE